MNKTKRIEFSLENIIHGLILGTLLFISSFITIFLINDKIVFTIFVKFIVLILLGYFFLGILCIVFHRRTRKTIEKNILHNAGGLYWIAVFAACIEIVLVLFPSSINRILGINLIVLFLIWLLEYLYLKNAAKQLNSSLSYVEETLVVELPDQPGTLDDIYTILEEYCSKNHIVLEILQKDLPGLVLLDGKRYHIKKSMDYSMVGMPVYALIITSALYSN